MHRPTLCSSLSLAALLFAASCTDAYVHPVGGTLTGLEAGTLVLALNGEDQITLSADGPFVFPRAMKQGTEFAVTVVEAPPNTQVSLANATGVVDKTIFDITVQVVPTLVIGGTLTGLDTGSVSLRINGGAPLTVASNGTAPGRAPRHEIAGVPSYRTGQNVRRATRDGYSAASARRGTGWVTWTTTARKTN